jgi:hypothetical protein
MFLFPELNGKIIVLCWLIDFYYVINTANQEAVWIAVGISFFDLDLHGTP